MKFVFLPEAVEDIERLHDFLLARSPLAAEKAMLAIDDGIRRLLENPRAGIGMDVRPDYRQLFVRFGKSAYVLRYRIDEESETLVVVRVWHGREDRGA
ncbi:type II toxin-antitoxin system RelE/ParE family toxin [Jiella avicenniae]|uniref:Type II toxin-antitoxin system RelE/ParE family toxin n=1 Tax=Jiella avicenniae TaxID=2907202 RepID=A0A9X1T4F6_9HYPH|nr:type II toxin-antitoxin system RelE/ParE family toxin [Jiella avicenniae]MCE7028511.1 type II toxin-antitoxin system RelE/ParE family toxin [Jiella avicenniae]